MAFDGKSPVLWNKFLPGQRAGALVEGVKVGGAETAQHQQHPLPGAQVQVDPGNIRRLGQAEHPAVLRPHSLQVQPAQLVGRQGLQAEEGRDHQL